MPQKPVRMGCKAVAMLIIVKKHDLPAGPQQVKCRLQTGKVSADDGGIKGLASLTPQQFRVLTMVCEGLLNKQIAYELSVSEATIKAHVTAIFRKLGVRTRTQAALLLQQLESVASN